MSPRRSQTPARTLPAPPDRPTTRATTTITRRKPPDHALSQSLQGSRTHTDTITGSRRARTYSPHGMEPMAAWTRARSPRSPRPSTLSSDEHLPVFRRVFRAVRRDSQRCNAGLFALTCPHPSWAPCSQARSSGSPKSRRVRRSEHQATQHPCCPPPHGVRCATWHVAESSPSFWDAT